MFIIIKYHIFLPKIFQLQDLVSVFERKKKTSQREVRRSSNIF